MIGQICGEIRPLLGALVDGELAGTDMLRATEHLEECSACAHEHASLRRIGDLLRGAVAEAPAPAMSGLADGVIARTRAERELSWGGLYHRAVDGWHWAIVGIGSVTGTALVTLVAAGVLFFGSPPVHGSSLSAVMSPRYMEPAQFEVVGGFTGRAAAYPPGEVYPLFLGSEREMVSWLSEYLSRPAAADLSRISEEDRRYIELLGGEIVRRRSNLRQVKLVTTTTVSASLP